MRDEKKEIKKQARSSNMCMMKPNRPKSISYPL